MALSSARLYLFCKRGVRMSNEVSAQAVNRSGLLQSEDWWAVWLGLFIVVLGAGQIWHVDLLGWVAKFGVWIIVWSIYHLNDPRAAVASGAGKVSKREIWERFPKFIIGLSWPWSSFLQLAGCSRASSTLRKPAPDRLTSCGPSSLSSASSLSAWSRMSASSGNPAWAVSSASMP